jgi:hypothetical protein
MNLDMFVDFYLTAGLFKGYFFFLGSMQLPENRFDKIIDEDGFKSNPSLNPDLRIYLEELEIVKEEFRKFLRTEIKSKPENSNQLIEAFIVRLRKIRLVVEFKIYLSFNLDHRSEKYLVGRSYWISYNGKLVKKFAKVLGKEDHIKSNGKIPSKIMEQLEHDLRKVMWETYKNEYSIK